MHYANKGGLHSCLVIHCRAQESDNQSYNDDQEESSSLLQDL